MLFLGIFSVSNKKRMEREIEAEAERHVKLEKAIKEKRNSYMQDTRVL